MLQTLMPLWATRKPCRSYQCTQETCAKQTQIFTSIKGLFSNLGFGSGSRLSLLIFETTRAKCMLLQKSTGLKAEMRFHCAWVACAAKAGDGPHWKRINKFHAHFFFTGLRGNTEYTLYELNGKSYGSPFWRPPTTKMFQSGLNFERLLYITLVSQEKMDFGVYSWPSPKHSSSLL